MEVYTTGFTKKTAAQFFGSLKQAGIKRLVDVRLKSFDEIEYGGHVCDKYASVTKTTP